MKDYRDFLEAIGRKPVPKDIRTTKRPGEWELVYSATARDWIAYRHEGDVA